MFTSRAIGLLIVVCCFVSISHASNQVPVGEFSQQNLNGWEDQVFSGQTVYSINTGSDGVSCLHALSRSSASGLVKRIRIDLWETPYLNWRWKMIQRPGNSSETSKSGDDFAARVYVIAENKWLFWRTRAINYVWANQITPPTHWDNPYTANSQMVAVQSGDKSVNIWLSEKRNVRHDLKTFFGKEIRYIDAVAVMTDSDGHQSQAEACYGDIFFSSD